jgi:Fe/S biogenesis protein NfuA
MIRITDMAKSKVLEALRAGNQEGGALRVAITGPGRGPGGFGYELELVEAGERTPGDREVDADGLPILVDGESAAKLEGAVVDYVEDEWESGFKIENPNSIWEDPVSIAVQKLLDDNINPAVAGHGGFVQLIDVKENKVYLQMGGGCQGCGAADVTLKSGIERLIKEEIPEIEEVLDTTDHESGSNPYYTPQK